MFCAVGQWGWETIDRWFLHFDKSQSITFINKMLPSFQIDCFSTKGKCPSGQNDWTLPIYADPNIYNKKSER